LTSNIVLEQYLGWSLPFLIVLVLIDGSRPAAFLLAWSTAAGLVMNHDIHLFGDHAFERQFGSTSSSGPVCSRD